MRVAFYFGLIVAVLFYFTADWVILILFGNKYQEAAEIAKVYIFTLPTVSMSIIFSHRYVLNGTTRHSLFGVIAGGLSAVILNVLIIPTWGPVGAAMASISSMMVPTMIVAAFLDRSVGAIFISAMRPVFWTENASRD